MEKYKRMAAMPNTKLRHRRPAMSSNQKLFMNENETSNADCLQRLVRHDGDCSCYKPDCEICDCGKLRDAIRTQKVGRDEIWTVWLKHLCAIERSVPNAKAEPSAPEKNL